MLDAATMAVSQSRHHDIAGQMQDSPTQAQSPAALGGDHRLRARKSDPARPLRAQQPQSIEEVETESDQRLEVVKILDHRYDADDLPL
jgi:hypothetical protein